MKPRNNAGIENIDLGRYLGMLEFNRRRSLLRGSFLVS